MNATVWKDLKPVLARLHSRQPGSLVSYPSLDSDRNRTPPFKIHLAAWAADAAKELHGQFGSNVELTVGGLPYPPGSRERSARRSRAAQPPPPLLDPREVAAELDGPAVVSSGHTLRHGLILRNLTGDELQLATSGHVTASVVDPQSGDVVGGYSGWQTAPLVFFRIAPGESETIPLLIGTASSRPELGYAVPAGEWGIQATLKLGPDPRDPVSRRTPVFPLTITG